MSQSVISHPYRPRSEHERDRSRAPSRAVVDSPRARSHHSFIDPLDEPVEDKLVSVKRGRWSSFVLWTSVACLAIIMLYIILVYSFDQRARDTRNSKHNLKNFVDYALSSAKLPHGHMTENSRDPDFELHDQFTVEATSQRNSVKV